MPAIAAFKPQPQKNITVSASTDDYNLRTAATLPYQATVICKVNSAVEIGSTSTSTPAWQTGSGWPKGTKVRLINSGTIAGKQGAGGNAGSNHDGQVGQNGGDAIKIAHETTVQNYGIIGGGGGGGGGGSGDALQPTASGGGTGAGRTSSSAGSGVIGGGNGSVGTITNGANSGDVFGDPVAAGGAPGVNGQNGSSPFGTEGGGGGGLGASGGYGEEYGHGPTVPGGTPGKAIDPNGFNLRMDKTGSIYGTYT